MGVDMVGVFVFIFGAIVGSFLNVCIVRLPHEQSVVKPRSHCVHCKKMIPWYDNIPFLSYLILCGRCRFCGKGISLRYILVELFTALSFWGFYKYFGLDVILLPYLVMLSCFIVATFVDFEHRIIPDEYLLHAETHCRQQSLYSVEQQTLYIYSLIVKYGKFPEC